MKFTYNNIAVNMVPYNKNDYLHKYYEKQKSFFEHQYLDFLNKSGMIKNKIVVDIGAHIGNHTIYFSLIGGAKKVISIEPTKTSYDVLCQNIKANKLSNIETHRKVISNKRGAFGCKTMKANNSGTNRWDEGNDNDRVPAVLLSDIVKNRFDFVKIDVETHEMNVLEGMKDQIMSYNPIVMIEISKNNLAAFLEFVKTINYEMIAPKVFVMNNKKANTFLIRKK